MSEKVKKLNQLASTAICGNDISSSVLYVSALAIAFAGQYAWVTLLIVSVVLFFYRRIYGEVVGALPLNGGAYNALLNTTSKSMASFAATLTLLSYMATAVISGYEGISYFFHLIPRDFLSDLIVESGSGRTIDYRIIITTVILLLSFAALVISGISESAKVAIGIFLFHLTSLVLLAGFVIYYLSHNGFTIFSENWVAPLKEGSISKAIFFGFAASMLGVSGFESSANFVEEQKKGVFPKTLRNMWVIVSIINPLMAVLALALFTMPQLQSSDFQETLLVQMGDIAGGKSLAYLIAIDAFLVLSGAVLTSFVGVSGLLERMTLDRVMPAYFLKKNRRGSSYRIIIMFFFLCVSVLMISLGDVELLAGVYTISFLSVMALFGVGNILLKVRRSKLPRPEKATYISVLFAIIAVLVALFGNILMPKEADEPRKIVVFLYYFIPSIAFVTIMLNRTSILKFILNIVNAFFNSVRRKVVAIDRRIIRTLNRINDQEFVFFTKGDDIATMNKVMMYISRNEHTKKVKVVIITSKEVEVPDNFAEEIDFLDREYPEIKVEFVTIEGEFTPDLIQDLSEKWNIPVNFMFIGSPSDHFTYRVEELGGVRLII